MSQQKQCPKCGELLDSEVRFCTRCGADQYAAAAGAPGTGPTGPYQQGPRFEQPSRVAPPKNYFIESILATLCCCIPLGIVAIINAVKVEGLANRGDWAGAVDAANKAKMWTIIAVVGGLLANVAFYFMFWPAFMEGFERGMEKARQEQLQRQQPQTTTPDIQFPTQ